MSGVNKVVRSDSAYSIFPDATQVVNSSVSFNEGDLLIFASNLLAHAAAEADGATFLGIAPVTVVSGKLASPYTGTAVDAAQAVSSIPGPLTSCVVSVIAKTGDAFTKGALVYLDPASGTRNVQAAGTKAIGVYQGATIASAAAGQEIEVLIGHRYPADVLGF